MTLRDVTRRLADLAGNTRGNIMIEFAIIAPVMLLLVLGTFQFGLVISNYVVLTDAVGMGARQLSLSRGTSTPYDDARSAVTGATPSLTTASITITLRVNGTTCSTNSACSTALSSAAGQSASVTATYPCSLAVYGYDFAPGCTLSAQMTGLVN